MIYLDPTFHLNSILSWKYISLYYQACGFSWLCLCVPALLFQDNSQHIDAYFYIIRNACNFLRHSIFYYTSYISFRYWFCWIEFICAFFSTIISKSLLNDWLYTQNSNCTRKSNSSNLASYWYPKLQRNILDIPQFI